MSKFEFVASFNYLKQICFAQNKSFFSRTLCARLKILLGIPLYAVTASPSFFRCATERASRAATIGARLGLCVKKIISYQKDRKFAPVTNKILCPTKKIFYITRARVTNRIFVNRLKFEFFAINHLSTD